MAKAIWQYVILFFSCRIYVLICHQASTGPSLSMQMQNKMMVYDQAISELNSARLRGPSFPIVHALIQASHRVSSDVSEDLPSTTPLY